MPSDSIGNLEGLVGEGVHDEQTLTGRRDESDSKGSLSPATEVLPEILGDIFFLCLPEDTPKISPDSMPLVLGRVCSFWRQVALATPMLWADVTIQCHFGSSDPEALLKAVNHWLSRASGCLISISALFDGNPPARFSRFHFEIVDAVVRLSSRWRRLELHLPWELQLHFFRIAPYEALELQDLVLNGGDYRSHTDEKLNPDSFHLPSLRRLSIGSTYLDSDTMIRVFSSSLSCLTHVNVIPHHARLAWARFSLRDAWDLLSRCAHVVECSLWISHRALTVSKPTIRLQNLRKMSVMISEDDLGFFCALLELPSLEEWRYLHESPNTPFYSLTAEDQFMDLLARSSRCLGRPVRYDGQGQTAFVSEF